MKTSLQKALLFIFFVLLLQGFLSAQNIPYQSAPVNGSTWETTSPTLYWWYVPSPYSPGPFNYSVQVSTSSSFSGSLVVDATVSGGGAASYSVSGLSGGTTYYWRIGVGGNYSAVWSFTPYGSGGGGTTTYYTITSTAGPNGSISPSGSTSIAEGNDQSYTITPDAGYEILDVEVDNVSVGAVATYDFTNVTADHTIDAYFQLIPEITYVAVTGDDLNGDGSETNPYRTIQHGINRTDDYGTLFVFDGNYSEDVNIQRPITIIGETDPSTSSFVIWESDVTIKNFDVYDANGSGPGPGIQKVGLQSWEYMENITLENIESHNNDELGLLLENVGYVTIKNCRFYNNQLDGFALVNCNNVTVENVGTEGNLRGFAMHNTSDITMYQIYVEDNDKIYGNNWPDRNGFTFTECENISISSLYSNRNEEQGFKFEDCSYITLENVTASENGTDGMAFINCDHITYNGGFANNNGSASGDNGAEFVKCTHFTLTDFSANSNYENGIYLGTRYTGEYQYDWGVPGGSPWTNEFIGICEDVTFENVSADDNDYGLIIRHTNFGEFTNLSMTNNLLGVHVDASHHLAFTGGTFDYNEHGIWVFPETHDHKASHNIFEDEITSLTFDGTVSISNNELVGLYFSSDPAITGTVDPYIDMPASKIVEPFFNGNFSIFDNGVGVALTGKLESPSFYGLYLKNDTHPSPTAGILIEVANSFQPDNVIINNSIFEGYDPGTQAIELSDSPSDVTNDVDARYNTFVNAADPETIIYHQADDPNLGLVDFGDWTSGKPIFYIGSASEYIGSLVTIPVQLKQPIPSKAESFNEIEGKIQFNDLNLSYQYAATGTGTLLHDADWTIIFNHTVSDELDFWAIGFNEINSSGTLFYLTFEVIAPSDGSEQVTCDPFDLYADNVANLFSVHDGTINYTSNTSISLLKGDASMDFDVDDDDYFAVLFHINGPPLLTGQALINADVNSDGIVNALDLADISAYIDTGIWPNHPIGGGGNLLFTNASVNSNGLLRFPVTVTGASNVRSLEIELTYDDSKVDFKNYMQLLCGEKYRVDAKRVSDGVTKVVFTSADELEGSLVPAEIRFNINGNPNALTQITSKYSINGGEMKQGPTFGSNGVTGVEEELIPEHFEVSQNYPNPFNPATTIRYSVPKNSFVSIKVYDILGREIKTLVNEEVKAGTYKVNWNGLNEYGSRVASGTYFYRVISGSDVVTKKMVLIK